MMGLHVVVRRYIGHRAGSLLILGCIFMLYGIGQVLGSKEPPQPNVSRSLHLALDIAPLWVWGYVWMIAGLTAVISALWPPNKDGVGFTAVTMLGAWWACVYGVGQLFYDADRAWTGSLVWVAVVTLTQNIAGWEEVPPLDRRRAIDRGASDDGSHT